MYAVNEYLGMMEAADSSPATIRSYRGVFRSYARFIGVPVTEIHDHLVPANLINYATAQKESGKSGRAIRMRLSVLRAYFEENGVQFGTREMKVLKARRIEDAQDKPLESGTLQRMMDLGNEHAKAIISTLVSTGTRPGELAALLVSDVNGDTIMIRSEIAKGKRGGKVYLTAEAREYLDLWLRVRNDYIKAADARSKTLVDAGGARPRPENDPRLFACAYTSLHRIWSRLYDKVDGERGKYGARCTPHSCRKYFRTHAVKTMSLDLVEKLMRHQGYLTGSYVRISDDDARKEFHAGEAALYITRKDHRVQQTEIELLKRERGEQATRLSTLERRMAATEVLIEYERKKK